MAGTFCEDTPVIHVVAIITAHPGKRAELLAAFAEVVPLVHKEKGCREYQPVTDLEGASNSQALIGADTYMVIEKWDSMEDLRAHAASDHIADFQNKAGHLVADRKIHLLG